MTVAARDDYLAFCARIRTLTGIDLAQYKRGQMERRVRSFAARRGEASLEAYGRALAADPAARDEFLDRMTINVSQLWRNPDQWRRLAESVVPELAERGRIRAWSAGCSYGAETYTLAALCREVAPGARLDIVGTDIDPRMVARAREGRFSRDDARSVPAASLARWFVEDGEELVARDELRRVLRFSQGDLLRDRFPADTYDLVLCRNVVIYFTEPVRDTLHERLAASLRTFGYLMVGASERVATPAAVGLLPTHPFIYRRAT